ncbi:hypothetical protein [Nodosilinea nodulosa]|uniref:hypothetical protein n=1 Tax=Nodosilinea nodulosa TaxID=416001 RepID=UPI0012D7BEE4|nr:hypothetical protein [Nodosilinea nodulosa]
MKRFIFSVLSAAAVVGAVAPIANAMPTRLENLRQANLNDVYLSPRQADAPHPALSQGQPTQQANSSRPEQIRQAHFNDVHLNSMPDRQVRQGAQGTSAQTQRDQQPSSRMQRMHLEDIGKR